jgi:CheY-like chemotaxis protein
MRILLYVEDNTADSKLVEQLIARRPDMRMLSALNATLGIQMARGFLPDVILMDIALPGMSGIQALKILRDDPMTAHIPVLAISAYALLDGITRAMKVGFFRYLIKPFKLNELLEAMDAALKFAGGSLDDGHQGLDVTRPL